VPLVDIRPIEAADRAALGAEVDRARAAGEFRASSDPEGGFFMKSLDFAPHPCAAAFASDGSLLGFVSPEFKIVVVRPDCRRRGIGRSLVEAGVGIERGRGRANLFVGVLPEDTAGRAFLGATGFAFHSTLWDLSVPATSEAALPAWPAGYLARPYERSRDAGPWSALFNAAFADHATPLQIDPAVVAAAPEDDAFVDADTLVLEELATGQLVGFCATQPERVDGGVRGRAEIWTIGVRPDRQGQGLGRQLLRWGVRYLRGLGVADVALSVNARNARALDLYRREGFAEDRARERWARPV
jgi:mycothiol synthase